MGFTHSRITYSKNTVAHWRNPVNYIFPKLVLFVCFFFHWEFKLNEKPGPLPFAVSDNLYAQFLLFVAFLVYSTIQEIRNLNRHENVAEATTAASYK